jgi:tetratricopeptide (TPR) repeat protein
MLCGICSATVSRPLPRPRPHKALSQGGRRAGPARARRLAIAAVGKMNYLLAVSLFVAVLLFQARSVIEGALRKVCWISLGIPTASILHQEGVVLSQAGRRVEAAQRYRDALAMAKDSSYPPERLHACLGYAFMDLGEYHDAEQRFHHAIEAGDFTGNSLDGLAELRVVHGVDAGEALDYASQAIEHAKRRALYLSIGKRVYRRIPGAYSAHRAWALAQLGRDGEALDQLAQALGVPEPTARGRASLHWRAGMALLAMHHTEEAPKHFRMGHDADPHGKYGCRCEQQLRSAA